VVFQRRIDVDQIDAAALQLAELVETGCHVTLLTAINDARIDERRGFGWHAGSYPTRTLRVNAMRLNRFGCAAQQKWKRV
jgi:hypothetical protein